MKQDRQPITDILHENALRYQLLLDNSYMIISKSTRSDTYFWKEITFNSFNFMHLHGIKSRTKTAEAFFQECLVSPTTLTINDLTPALNHERIDIRKKGEALKNLLDLKRARSFTFGDKNKITRYNDFAFAYGKNGILGFIYTSKEDGMALPRTCIPNRNIEEFCSKIYSIDFILVKKSSEEQYNTIYKENKKGLFRKLLQSDLDFPIELRSKIDVDAIIQD